MQKLKKSELKAKVKTVLEKRQVQMALVAIIGTLILLLVLRLFLLVFPIREFEIVGDTRYDINEILNASGIRSGKPLYGINVSKAEKKLEEECKYIKEVNIKRKFPDKICFEIEERVAGWYLQVGEDFYALDYDLKILLETYSDEDMKERGITKLVLPELESAIVGELPKFGHGDELLMSETLKIIDSIRDHDIKGRLTYLNLENRFEIKMTVDETFEVNLGDMSDYETKLDMIEKIISQNILAGYAGGEINMIDSLSYSFRGYYNNTDGETTENGKEDE